MLSRCSFADTSSRCCLADRKYREGRTCRDAFVVRHQARICEWHRVEPRGEFFVNRARIFVHPIMLLLSHTRRPGLIRSNPRLKRCTFHCGKCMHPFPYILQCLRLVFALCVYAFMKQTWHALLPGVFVVACEDMTSYGRRSVGGEPPNPCVSHVFNESHLP